MNKTWLITGCSSGFGRALAEQVLQRGDKLLATARKPEQLADMQARYPETCQVARLDVTQLPDIHAALEHVQRIFGRLDVVVNNAGYGLLGALEEFSDEQMRRNMEVNFFGAVQVIREVLPIFRAQKSGHIINMTAAAAISNYAGFSIYGASKFALEGLSESVAAEGKSLGIKVTCVEPGPFRTDFIKRSMERAPASITDYENTVGKFAGFLDKMDGKQPGDPTKAALAIISCVDAEVAPLRLVLGKYAIDKVERSSKMRLRELETWKEVGLSADGALA
ncbi:MAG: oxidoreductase [Blastochloris sp.]|nr:oxidoreductase [Blastochloris sp.]